MFIQAKNGDMINLSHVTKITIQQNEEGLFEVAAEVAPSEEVLLLGVFREKGVIAGEITALINNSRAKGVSRLRGTVD